MSSNEHTTVGFSWFERIAARRKPDFEIFGPSEDPYLQRWWIIPRNRWFNIYLHKFYHSDDDRALHDHPWLNVSVLLKGEYWEVTRSRSGMERIRCYVAGDVKFRLASTPHRIVIDRPCWSLFITGPVVREWGFHCPKGWRHWKEYTADGHKGKIGRGCE